MQINTYGRWEQAFRVFSNILTSKYPEKAPELLQYNHTIHSASTTYTWENVYAYDREFRQHVARYPTRVWNVILQLAWTMLLKDRIKFDHRRGGGGSGGRGNQNNMNKRDKEPCRRFNKGRCTYGLSCRYDHRCSVPKCGKYGHGAHVCRIRDSNQGQSAGSSDRASRQQISK